VKHGDVDATPNSSTGDQLIVKKNAGADWPRVLSASDKHSQSDTGFAILSSFFLVLPTFLFIYLLFVFSNLRSSTDNDSLPLGFMISGIKCVLMFVLLY